MWCLCKHLIVFTSSLFQAVHTIPVVILLVLLTSTLALLLLCIVVFSGVKQREILTNRDSCSGNSRTWRTQRQLCRLFLVLSLSYAFGLLPSLIYEFFFNHDEAFDSTSSHNSTNATENASVASSFFDGNDSSQRTAYEQILASITRRQMSATILNVFQNLAHAISFYIYITCSEEFRNEFKGKLKRIGCHLRTAYSSFRSTRFSIRHSAQSYPLSPLIRTTTTTVHQTRRANNGTANGQFLTCRFADDEECSPNMELLRVHRREAEQTQLLLSENEGEDWDEEPEPSIRRAQSDVRFYRRVSGVARELSCQFYSRIGTLKEQSHGEANGESCLVVEARTNENGQGPITRNE